MTYPDDALDAERIRAAAARCGVPITLDLRDTCESTNTVLLDAPPAEAGVLHVLACERQTAGRGRRGRSWLSWGPGSLTFSVAWRFAQGAASPMGLSLAAGVAVAEACESLGARGVRLKWPNDILFDFGKLGGILTELSSGGGALTAVIGLGLNLRLDHATPIDIPVAALDQALVAMPSRSELLGTLAGHLGLMLAAFSRDGFSDFRAAWASRNAHAGLPVQVLSDLGTHARGICVGVDNDGALLLDNGGARQRILSGDVSLRSA